MVAEVLSARACSGSRVFVVCLTRGPHSAADALPITNSVSGGANGSCLPRGLRDANASPPESISKGLQQTASPPLTVCWPALSVATVDRLQLGTNPAARCYSTSQGLHLRGS